MSQRIVEVDFVLNASKWLLGSYGKPKPRKLLTDDEYRRQGEIETQKALEELREFCQSPKCSPWKTLSRLETPKRYNFFSGHSLCCALFFSLNSDSVLRYLWGFEPATVGLPIPHRIASTATEVIPRPLDRGHSIVADVISPVYVLFSARFPFYLVSRTELLTSQTNHDAVMDKVFFQLLLK